MSSAIVDKYIGESARLIREMFGMLFLFQLSVVCGSKHRKYKSKIYNVRKGLKEKKTTVEL